MALAELGVKYTELAILFFDFLGIGADGDIEKGVVIYCYIEFWFDHCSGRGLETAGSCLLLFNRR